MAVNKVIVGGETVLDLTEDTVEKATLIEGYTAHDKSGNIIAGAFRIPRVQSKTVTPTMDKQYVSPDDGYSYLSMVVVNPIPIYTEGNNFGGDTLIVG